MKHTFITSILLGALFVFPSFYLRSNNDFIDNGDQPSRGQWQFSPHKKWSVDSAGEEVLNNVISIRLDTSGKIYLLEGRPQNRIHVFSKTGQHQLSFCERGEGPGEIKDAFDFFIQKKHLIVVDSMRIHYFTLNGKYTKTIKIKESLIPYLFLDQNQLVAIPLQSIMKKVKVRPVFIYNLMKGSKQKIFQVPQALALRYSDKGNNYTLKPPYPIDEELRMIERKGSIFYGYSNQNIIEEINLKGEKIKTISIEGRSRKKISTQVRMKVIEKTMTMHRNLPKNLVRKMAEQLPHQLPYFHHLFVDDRGLIYKVASSILNSHQLEIDMITSKGKYIYQGQLNLQKGFSVIQLNIKNEDLVAFVEDLEGERILVKYRIKIPKWGMVNTKK